MAQAATGANRGKFMRYSVALCVLGVVLMFLYSGLQNDQINIIQASSAWNNNATQMPITVGNFVCIILTFIYGTLFIKFGVKKVLIPCIALSAIGCVGIAAANGIATLSADVALATEAANSAAVTGNYVLYFISLFIVRCTCMCFQMSGFMLAANWFIAFRGRALGIITLGSPLFSLIGTSMMTTFIATHLNGDYRPFYIGICVVLVIVAILVALLIKDTPEQCGLYPDGSDHPPVSEGGDEVNLTVKQVLSQKKSWMLVANFGAFQFVINCCMASMVAWFTFLCVTNADAVAAGALGGMFQGMGGLEGAGAMALFAGQAAKYLSLGVIIGIVMSFVFGVIDDKLGTPLACVLLGITCILPPLGLLMQANAVATTGSCNIPMLIVWGFGVACMTGGVPTMHPASMSYVFGRREYQSANRIIMAIQLIPSALAATLMFTLIQKGHGVGAYIMVICVAVFGIVTSLPMFKMEDANAADRAYVGKK